MSEKYFGYPEQVGGNPTDPVSPTADSNAAIWLRNDGYVTTFVCPGDGSYNVSELTAWVSAPVDSGSIRLAIYTNEATPALMAQGSAKVQVVGGPSWQGHIGAGNITQTTPLTGGQTYLIAYSKDGSGALNSEYYITGVANDYEWAAVDETGGFPSTLAHPVDQTAGRYCVRCGVDYAGGGSTPLTFAGSDDLNA